MLARLGAQKAVSSRGQTDRFGGLGAVVEVELGQICNDVEQIHVAAGLRRARLISALRVQEVVLVPHVDPHLSARPERYSSCSRPPRRPIIRPAIASAATSNGTAVRIRVRGGGGLRPSVLASSSSR
jgi:hypothetical protein